MCYVFCRSKSGSQEECTAEEVLAVRIKMTQLMLSKFLSIHFVHADLDGMKEAVLYELCMNFFFI